MDVQAAIGSERDLRRIIALLVSLAVLAERAATRSSPVRWLVLLILRRAKTAAEAFVLDATGLPAFLDGFEPTGNGPADALRLATRFRALAATLSALLPAAFRLEDRFARRGFAFGEIARDPGNTQGARRLKPNDTS